MLMSLFPDNSLVVEVEKFKMENDLNSDVIYDVDLKSSKVT